MEEYKIQLTNGYTIEQLADFVESGQVTFDRLRMAKLTLQKQKLLEDELSKRREEKEVEFRKYKEEEALYNFVDKERTLNACETYFSQYKKEDPYAKHWFAVYAIFISIKTEGEKKKKKVLDDMKEHSWRYRQDDMKLLLGDKKMDDEVRKYLIKENPPYADMLLSGTTLCYDELVNSGVIPEEITKQDLYRPDFVLPATNIKDMGDFPTKRTDVFFLGVPRSGKSSLLSGLIKSLHNMGNAGYESQIVNGKDPCLKYYNGLIDCMSTKKPPQGTATDTISFMKLNIRDDSGKKVNRVTIVELSGESFNMVANSQEEASDIWKELGAVKCLESKNRKLLLFVLDYGIITGKNPEVETTADEQRKCLENSLRVFQQDGAGGKENCTLNKVDTVGIIMTKCDLMKCSSYEERMAEAKNYVDTKFREFMNSLRVCCKDFGINVENDYEPIILLFSLGHFYVGNTFLFDDTYSKKIIKFIRDRTRGEKKGGIFGSIFGQ